jgi:transmembrane sensor
MNDIVMKNYLNYSASDFILDDFFVDWVKSPTKEQDRFWQQWLTEHPERAHVVDEARSWVQAIRVNEDMPSDQKIQKAIQQIEAEVQQAKPMSKPFPLTNWLWHAAAVLAIVVGIGYSLSIWKKPLASSPGKPESTLSSQIGEMVAQENHSENPITLQLPDSSRVILSPKSKLVYPKFFANAIREINLTGEAFFDVVRQPDRPFVVHTGQVNVRVLGTSFLVKAYRNDPAINVQVKSGKVSVSKARAGEMSSPEANVLITPNQQVTYSVDNQVFRKALVEVPVLVDKTKKEGDFVYDEVPVTTVFQQLKAAYGIDVVYEADKLANCTLTARLSNESMYQKFNMICQAIGATHETVGTQIIIHAQGCEKD